jgi:hypothetical protein
MKQEFFSSRLLAVKKQPANKELPVRKWLVFTTHGLVQIMRRRRDLTFTLLP